MSSNTFTASNGKKVARVPGGLLAGEVAVYRDEAKALREFFQHERDEQLGRERVSNSILITPLDPKSVNVLREIHVYNEVTRQYVIWNETSDGQVHRVTLFTSNMLDSAARQWFSENPRPKPLPIEPGTVLQGTGPNRTILHRSYPVNGRDDVAHWVALSGVRYTDAEVNKFFQGQFVRLVPESSDG